MIEDLQNGFKIIQDKRYFKFGTDAVLLSRFAKVKKGEKVLDLCAGSGIVPLLLKAKQETCKITGIEIIPKIADMAQRSMALNGVDIDIVCMDLKQITENTFGVFDVVTCNPPYLQAGSGFENDTYFETIARSEVKCTIDDVAGAMARCLKFGGRYYLIHRADRLCDVIAALKKHGLEPKQIQLIYGGPDKEAKLVLIGGTRGANSGVRILLPQIVNGASTAEMIRDNDQ